MLIPLSLALTLLGLTGYYFLAGGLILGLLFLNPAVKFASAARTSDGHSDVLLNVLSRRIFFASLAYLPVLMLLMSLDKA